jgi:hypothetical protein
MGKPRNLHLLTEDLGARSLSEVLGAHPLWDRAREASSWLKGCSCTCLHQLRRSCSGTVPPSPVLGAESSSAMLVPQPTGGLMPGRGPASSCGFSERQANHGSGAFGRMSLPTS